MLVIMILIMDFVVCFSTNKNPKADEKNIIFNEPKDNLIFFLGLGYEGEKLIIPEKLMMLTRNGLT